MPLFVMALSKRNTNPITVDDVEFRWAVSARSQGATDRVTVVVQPPENGCRLAVAVPCRDPYLNIETDAPSYDVRDITPGFVRRLIDGARRLGWQPYAPGAQFTIACVIAEARGNVGETCHACWQCPSCNEWYSDDIEFGQQPPMLTACGRSKHHSSGRDKNVILFW